MKTNIKLRKLIVFNTNLKTAEIEKMHVIYISTCLSCI